MSLKEEIEKLWKRADYLNRQFSVRDSSHDLHELITDMNDLMMKIIEKIDKIEDNMIDITPFS